MKIKTLVIDDDPHWQKILSKMVEINPFLELLGIHGSAMEAYAQLGDTELLICDIELPDMKGIDFVKSLRQSPMVIFVTSHADYALDCYEVAPVDFLLKGFPMERFLKSIERVRAYHQNTSFAPVIDPHFFVRDGLNYVQIRYRDVLYMKSQDNNLLIVTPEQTYSPVLTIPKIEEHLKGGLFLRVHRSFLINRAAIKMIIKNEIILTNGDAIPIGDQYRALLNRKLMANNLISRNP
jgi:DNA-binding LytR/AlgR family response regulator